MLPPNALTPIVLWTHPPPVRNGVVLHAKEVQARPFSRSASATTFNSVPLYVEPPLRLHFVADSGVYPGVGHKVSPHNN